MKKPHLLFFIVDQMQQQKCGVLDPFAHTPHFDRLAEEGVFFNNAFASNPQCVPSRVSMQTGLYPHEAEVMIIYGFHGHTAHLTKDNLTVGQVLRDQGYTTAYFGKTHFGCPLKDLGYDHGYDADLKWHKIHQSKRAAVSQRDEITVQEAVTFIENYKSDRPLFLTVSLLQPHPPFEMVEKWQQHFPRDQITLPRSFYEDDLSSKPAFIQKRAGGDEHEMVTEEYMIDETQRYYTMIANADDMFGQIRTACEAQGLWDNMTCLVTSDHGDMMGAHRLRLKGTLPYDELFRVPMIMVSPDLEERGQSIDSLIVNTGIAPTLIEAAGVEVPDLIQGQSYWPLLNHQPDPENEKIFLEHYGAYWGIHPFRMLRTHRYKYVKYYGPDQCEEFYDLEKDPNEITNRAGDPAYTALQQEFSQDVDQWWQQTGGRDYDYYASEHFMKKMAAG